jgi:hypothetical protein
VGLRFPTKYHQGDRLMNRQLAEAVRYRAYIEDAAKQCRFQSSVIAGIGSRESQWGLSLDPPGPDGTGDLVKRPFPARHRDGPLPPDGGGFGRGLLQIDYDYHQFARAGNWKDPRENIFYGAKILADCRSYFERETNLEDIDLLRAATASYNAGPRRILISIQRKLNFDSYTTGGDYSTDVLSRAGFFQLKGWD